MNIDQERFQRLIPIKSLDARNRAQLQGHVRVEIRNKGDKIIEIGDTDRDFVYLQAGEIELISKDASHKRLRETDEAGYYPLANLKPRQYTGLVASSTAEVLRVDGQILEHALAWNQMARGIGQDEGLEVAEIDDIDIPLSGADSSWMLALLQTEAFRRLPSANIETLFSSFEPVAVKAGEAIVRFGEPGDYYYVIRNGRCAVARPAGNKEVKLAELKACDSFGEDALISDEPRNATVTMLTDGVLMRLSKADFTTLLEEPLVRRVSLQEASQLIRHGAVRLDVRTEAEHAHNGIKSSLNIPLYLTRLKAKSLDPKRKYVLYCDTGVRSSAAAFILAKLGLDVYVLEGGLTSALANAKRI